MESPLRILIVEDSEDDTILLIREIKKANFLPEWKRVDTEKEMVHCLNHKQWDIILVDYTLPQFNGMDALKLIRKMQLDIPAIMVSGKMGEATAVKAMRAGASDYILKGNYIRLIPAIKRELKEFEIHKEKQKVERALRKSAEMYGFIAENVSDVIWTADLNLKLKYVSPSVERLLGFTVDEALNATLIDFLTYESFKYVRKLFKRELKKHKLVKIKPVTFEIKITCKDESIKYVENVTSVLAPDGKNIQGILGVSRDITVRKQIEKQLRHSEKMEAIGKVAGGIAHDFNNQLVAISGYADILCQMFDKNEIAFKYADIISRAAERSAGLTKELLSFSRRTRLVFKPVDIHSIVLEIIDKLKQSTGENIRIKTSLKARNSIVNADSGEMQNAFLNIILNACHAMNNEGTICFKTTEEQITNGFIDYTTEQIPTGNYLCLSISDTGCGMSKNTLRHIFEPCFTTKMDDEGTGMGLAAVYGIIKSHGGVISVYSKIGCGSVFKIFLPLVNSSVGKFFTNLSKEKPVKGNANVLIVEDEEIVLTMTSEALKSLGYTVKPYISSNKAIKYYKKNWKKVDLLILDLMIPNISEADWYTQIYQVNPHAKTIFSSGFDTESIPKNICTNNSVYILEKPYQIVKLSKVLAKAMSIDL